jgi:hypothetical protein
MKIKSKQRGIKEGLITGKENEEQRWDLRGGANVLVN